MTPHLLVVAKAPVPGKVKTRLGHEIGMPAAAALAAAALADTVAACAATYGPERCCLALSGSLETAVDGDLLTTLVDGWFVFPQRGEGLGARIVNAHADAGRRTRGSLIQVGMDTPQVTPALLAGVGMQLATCDAVLGPATDGGWWVLAAKDPTAVASIVDVPMSTSTTGDETRQALVAAGLRVASASPLTDVDTAEEAHHVAALIPDSRFAQAWARVAGRTY